MIIPERDKALICRYVDGAVTEGERLEAERLLHQSPALQAYQRELLQLNETLQVVESAQPSTAWETRVERRLRGASAAAAEATPRARRTMLTWSLGGVSCAAAGLLVLVLISHPSPALKPKMLASAGPGPQASDRAAERQASVAAQFLGNQMGYGTAGRVSAMSSSDVSSTAGGMYCALPALEPVPGYPVVGVSNTEQYDRIYENRFLSAKDNPLSTFSIDVDTASYANVRRFLTDGQLPPEDAVRIEEMINYFGYDYPQPTGGAPFSITLDRAACPWNAAHQLMRVGLRGKVYQEQLPPSNLVFVIDVSGSMDEPN